VILKDKLSGIPAGNSKLLALFAEAGRADRQMEPAGSEESPIDS
jgi:hypothetical protein